MVPNLHSWHHQNRLVHCDLATELPTLMRLCAFQCAFANSQLNDILWISVDYAANVMGIQHTVLGSGGSCSGDSIIDKDALEEFNTDVLIKRSELGQVYVSNVLRCLCKLIFIPSKYLFQSRHSQLHSENRTRTRSARPRRSERPTRILC